MKDTSLQLFPKKFSASLLFYQLCFYSEKNINVDSIKFTSKFIKYKMKMIEEEEEGG